MEILTEFSRLLRQHRRNLGLSQAKAARLCGINEKYYSRIERGEINLTLETLGRIANAFGICAGSFIPRAQGFPSEMGDVCLLVSGMAHQGDRGNLAATQKYITRVLEPSLPHCGGANRNHCARLSTRAKLKARVS